MGAELETLPENWDLIIIGGGITGAGILREAAPMGLRVLLAEQKDFAWGTSSRSSKLVHGGLRYLKEGHPLLTKASVEERERLLIEASGLVESLGVLLPVYSGHGLGKWTLVVALTIYDLMAHKRQHRFYSDKEFLMLVPRINKEGLVGGFRFLDAQVDDARLVLRLIQESVALGANAMNYLCVTEIQRNARGEVVGVTVRDTETGAYKTLSCGAVINATGSWAEKLHPSPERKRHLRLLRGSHLVFPSWVFPIPHAVSFFHPSDNRPILTIPWEGAVLVGTTDIDHKEDLSMEPSITEEEIRYLMESLQTQFPSLEVSLKHCISTFAGVRPVLSEGKLPPSKESREHVVWIDNGLVTVTGGKLTTFRRLAWDALKAARPFLPTTRTSGKRKGVFLPVPEKPEEYSGIPLQAWRRLCGRYGKSANELVKMAAPEDLVPVPGTYTLWAELPFVAKREQVRHLSDLLLRRVRIGLLTSEGGKKHLDRIQSLCEPVLPWDRKTWIEERAMYLEQWRRVYAPPIKRVADE
jgi:glycerol-3-phosphate dehydrogenase